MVKPVNPGSASANNVVIESILRCAPLIINRHPAVEEYLGKGYPLFFDHIEEVADLLETDTILSAHQYLEKLDKAPFTGESFMTTVSDSIDRILVARSEDSSITEPRHGR